MTRRSFAAGFMLVPALRAQLVSKSKERGQAVLNDCLAALGGQKFLAMQDRIETGRAYSFYREQLTGLSIAKLFTRYPEPPQPVPESYYGILERQNFGKKQDIATLFNLKGGFELTFRGARPLPDQTVQRHQSATITNFLYILRQRLREPGMSFESQGITVVENQRVEELDVFDNAGRQITVYIAANSNLPVMQKYMRFDNTYKVRMEEIARYSKFRDVGGGVMWPFDFQRERDGEKNYQMFSDSVSIGNNFEAGLFDLPSGVKMLKQER